MKVTSLFGTFAAMMLVLAGWHSPTQAMVMTIADYQFSNSLSPTIAAPGVAISGMGSVSTGTIAYQTAGTPSPGSGHPSAKANGFDESTYTSYYTFTLDADAGHWLDLTQLDFYAYQPGTGTPPNKATYLIDGANETEILASTVSGSWAAYGAPLAITKETGEIEVRLWAKDFGSSATTYRIDDIKLTGRVGAIMALFNFNDYSGGTTSVTTENVRGTPTLTLVEEGGSMAQGAGSSGTGYTDAGGTTHSGGIAAIWTDGVRPGGQPPNTFELDIDTTGYNDLELRFDHRSPGSVLGPTTLTMEWAVGAGPYSVFDTISLIRDSQWHEYSRSLADILAIQGTAGAKIRGTWSIDAEAASNGKIDNLQLTGYIIPEPSTLMLLAIGLMALAGGRRWKRRRRG